MADRKRNEVLFTTAIAAATALVLLSVVFRFSWSRKRRSQQNQTKSITKLDGHSMIQFEKAVNKMKSSSFTSKIQLTINDKLMLYGWYKQVTVGDAPNSLPTNDKSWNVMEQAAKYNAWCRVRGMSVENAAIHYVKAVENFESMLDWEGSDSDEDDQDIYSGGASTTAAVSRPLEESHEIDDHYDDAIHEDGSFSYESQLFRAASQNDVDKIRLLLSDSLASSLVNVNHIDPTGQSALHVAADKGSVDALKVLVQEFQADVNLVDSDGISVLQTAVIAGKYDVCEWLLRNTDANPDQQDNDGDTPRLCAQDDDMIRTLFDNI